MKEALKWFDLILKCGEKKRQQIRLSVLNALNKFSDKGEGHSDTRAGTELSMLLQDKGEYEYIGITPNVMYAKEKGEPRDLNAVWVHPWGSPTLLYKHKRLPVVLMVNPGIRFNESMLREMKFNAARLKEFYELSGLTG